MTKRTYYKKKKTGELCYDFECFNNKRKWLGVKKYGHEDN